MALCRDTLPYFTSRGARILLQPPIFESLRLRARWGTAIPDWDRGTASSNSGLPARGAPLGLAVWQANGLRAQAYHTSALASQDLPEVATRIR